MGFDSYSSKGSAARRYDPFYDKRQTRFVDPDFDRYNIYLEDPDRERLTKASMFFYFAALIGDGLSMFKYMLDIIVSLVRISRKRMN